MTPWNKLATTICITLSSHTLFAQLPERVGSLIQADRDAAAISVNSTPFQALNSIVDKTSVFYVPSAVNAYNYLNNRPNIPDVLTWTPTFALVSKSLEFGVTSGPMDFQKMGARKRKGEYLTIWKRNKKGKWLVDLRAEVENESLAKPLPNEFIEPSDVWYLKHRSKVRLDQRKDIILETDKVMSTILKADNQTAYREFLSDDARLLFPWSDPIQGKAKIMSFFKKKNAEIETTPVTVGRAYSGEYAYSQGIATIRTKEKVVKYNYIRVWELSDKAKDEVASAKWHILIEMMFEI